MAATTTTTTGKMPPAAQLPNEQEQSKAPAVQSDPNIDMLQSMMNLILIQSGRFIKEHQAGGGTGRMKLSMQRAVPIATERFHDALDELENKIYLANTVLRRDLALEKEKRKKREAAAKEHEVQRARQAAEAKNAPPAPPLKEEEEFMSVEKVASPVAVEVTSKAPDTASPVKEEQSDLKRDDSNVPPPIKTDNDEPPRDPLFDATPTTANPQESDFDFEAMFGDSAMDTGGDNNHDDMMMDMTGDMGFSLDDGNDGPSLLRGLEDFAKSGDDSNNAQDAMDLDLPMPDLPDLNNAAEPQPAAAPESETKKEPTAKAETPKAAAPPPPAPEPAVETKVEDNNSSANDMMATMAVDDLEDLFNMDEYENPENSSFDDAFFNFE